MAIPGLVGHKSAVTRAKVWALLWSLSLVTLTSYNVTQELKLTMNVVGCGVRWAVCGGGGHLVQVRLDLAKPDLWVSIAMCSLGHSPGTVRLSPPGDKRQG